MRLDVEAVRLIIEDLERRFRPLHERVKWRSQHYHRDEQVDPVLPDHLKDATRYQSPILAKVGTELIARLNENTWVTHVEPSKDIARLREDANRLEQVFEQGKSVSEDRPNGDLQHGLSMGLVQKCYGVVHTVMAEHIWPQVPEPEYLEPAALGGLDETERGNYVPLFRAPGEPESAESDFPYMLDEQGMLAFGPDNMPQRRPVSRYRETDEALQERYKYDCAKAGWPWLEEVIDAGAFMFVEDRSLKNGMAIACVVREVPLLQYLEQLAGEKKPKKRDTVLSLHEADAKLDIHGERNAPAEHEPSRGSYGTIARVYQLWTRDEFYEVLAGPGATNASSGLEIVKSGQHPYGMPPFFLAYGRVDWTSSDPVNRYRPALDDLYALKPQFDRLWTLYNAMAEMNALPFFYWKQVGTGEPLRGTDGQIEYFTRNAADAAAAPDGYELARIEMDTGRDFLTALQMLDEAMAQATPSTGQTEIEASTQPWTARLAQAQASVEPRMFLGSIAKCLRQMRRMQAHVMSLKPEDGGFVQPPIVFARKEGGKVNYQELVFVPPEAVRSLNIDVDINGTSAQEQITQEMHGIELLSQGLITKPQFFEEYAGRENPDEQIRKLDEEQMFEQYVKPGLVRRKLIEAGLLDITLGPDGQYYDSTGMPVSSQDVLMRNGQMPMGGAPMGPDSPMPPEMGGLPGLSAPDTMPLPGMPG